MPSGDNNRIQLAVLISGGGTNLQALIDACNAPNYPAEIAVVICNRPNAYGLERAKAAGIAHHIIDHTNYNGREDFDSAVLDVLADYKIDLICLAGFMRILTPSFINRWENRIINTHPALLPMHGGEGMYGEHVHRAVIESGDRESGVTIHYVIADVDRGDIIMQSRVPVIEGDNAEALSKRVLQAEHEAYPLAVAQISEKLLNSAANPLK